LHRVCVGACVWAEGAAGAGVWLAQDKVRLIILTRITVKTKIQPFVIVPSIL